MLALNTFIEYRSLMDSEWMSAAEARELSIKSISQYHFPQMICKRAHAGLVKARARLLVWHKERRENCDVPEQFWWADGLSALRQNWTSGDFETLIDGRYQCQAYGVSFKRADIIDMLPPVPKLDRMAGNATIFDTSKPAQKSQTNESAKNSGRPPAEWWDNLWIEICRQLYCGELIPKKQSDLEKAMLDWLATQGETPSVSTIRARARPLWDAISQEDKN